MLLPNFIEGVGNEVLACTLALGGVLFYIGFRLYNNGIRVSRFPHGIRMQSTNSNSGPSVNATSTDENVDNFHTGVLDTEYMESLRVSEPASENDSSTHNDKHKENMKNELENIRNSGNIVIRLQYLNDRVRYVHAPPDMPITLFKRKFFTEELEQNKSVRLIFQGRELKPNNLENSTGIRLRDYAVADNSTIHCLITDAPRVSIHQEHQDTSPRAEPGIYRANFNETLENVDFGSHMLMPLLAFLLVCVWLFRLAHSEYFSLISNTALICLSVMFLTGAYAYFSTPNNEPSMNTEGSATSPTGAAAAAGDSLRS